MQLLIYRLVLPRIAILISLSLASPWAHPGVTHYWLIFQYRCWRLIWAGKYLVTAVAVWCVQHFGNSFRLRCGSSNGMVNCDSCHQIFHNRWKDWWHFNQRFDLYLQKHCYDSYRYLCISGRDSLQLQFDVSKGLTYPSPTTVSVRNVEHKMAS